MSGSQTAPRITICGIQELGEYCAAGVTHVSSILVPRRFAQCRCVFEGSCRCGAISFSVNSHTPYPYQRCYCSICRKSAGGGGYAINIMGLADTLKVKGKRALGVWNAPIEGHNGSADRHYCKRCGTPLWVSDEQWPELVHPFASAIDTELPKAPSTVHCCCGTMRAGSNRRSAPMTTASTAIPNCPSRTDTRSTCCGSNDGACRRATASAVTHGPRQHLVDPALMCRSGRWGSAA
jgi:hypothetical protein